MTPAAVDRTEVALWQSGNLRCIMTHAYGDHVVVQVRSGRVAVCTQLCPSPDAAASTAESLWNLLVEH